METIYHKSETRGHAEQGWLSSKHTFSFAGYYNPARMNFGKLRVLNDDIIQPGMGFGLHSHDNMEIISVPVYGEMIHKDSQKNEQVIKPSYIQLMSAGKGIYHSEFNNSNDHTLNFLQLWIEPSVYDTDPGYNLMHFPEEGRKNKLQQIAGPEKSGNYLFIRQDTSLFLGDFDKGVKTEYNLRNQKNGIYIFVIDGVLQTFNYHLNRRDGLGLKDLQSISFEAEEHLKILLIEVPV